ncbi:MAG: ABC transporter ATP-binding protein/permease [Bacilli bacterium]|nr:ABC transporter ATP-binding protein/permease [Bacilli bacterium]
MPPVKQNIEKPKNFKKTLKKTFKYLKEYKISLIIVVILTMLSTVFSIVGPKILGNATTEIFKGISSKLSGGTGVNFDNVFKILFTLGILYVVSAIFSYIQGIIMTNIAQKTSYKLRKEIIEKINHMPFSYFDKKSYGETLSVITNDSDNLSMGINQSATQLISSITALLGIFIMMLTINVTMTLVTLILIPISLVLVSFIVKKSQHYFKDNQEYLASVNGKVEEMYSGQNIIKAFNNEEYMVNDFKKENEKLYNCAWKSNFISGLMHPIMNFTGNLGYVGIAVLGAYNVVKGRITIGNVQSFIQYAKNFTQPINQMAQISATLQSTIASAERIFDFLEEKEEPKVTNPIKLNNVLGNVEFKHVSFGYDEDNIIIHDFNAKVKAGQKIAIVGPTGAGKTTMVKLLMKFYQPTKGSILLDGVDLSNINRSDLKGIFGMVLQDTWLFSGTIMENIRYGKIDATDEEVKQAAITANINHYIMTQPDTYNMVLNEETNNISGGQKQLLTIARAILSNPKVLILDEATSSVDTRTEILIQEAMDKLMKGRTSFIIAHRLSTIKNADLILVMDNGDIVEQGTHEELLKKNGFYANLYNSQFDKVS